MLLNDSNLLTSTELRDYFLLFQEGKVFWGAFDEVLLKNYWCDWNKVILTPIVFRIIFWNKIKYAWKIFSLEQNIIDLDIYKDLLEAENLLLLMSYLIKDYLQKQFKWIKNDMTYREIALCIWDKQFVVSERIRQLLVWLCNDLVIILEKNNIYE